MQDSKNWLARIMEQTEKEYEALPEWKKRLWEKSEFLEEQKIGKTGLNPFTRYEHHDWT